MWYFYAILFAFVILSYRYDYRQRKLFRGFSFYAMYVVLVGVAGFRYRMGVDSLYYEWEYLHDFPTLTDLTFKFFSESRYQPLYIIFEALCKSISKEFFFFQLAHAAIVNGVIFWFFRKYTKHTFFGLFLYALLLYIPFNMEVMRESIAVAFFLLGWPAFRRGNWLVYYIFSFISFGFHISAIVTMVVPLFWIKGLRNIFIFGKRTIFLCAGLLVLSFGLYKVFFEVIQVLSINDTVTERANTYSENELGSSMLNIKGMIGYLLKFAVYPLLALYFMQKGRVVKKLASKRERTAMVKEEYMTMWNIYMALVTLAIAIFHRYNNYFAPFAFLIVSDWVFTPLKVGRKILRLNYVGWLVMFIPLLFIHIYSFYVPVNQRGNLKQYMIYAPYKSRLNPELDKDREEVFRSYDNWW